MDIFITTRHFNAEEKIKAYLTEKLEKLENCFSKIVSIRAVLAKEGFRYAAELILTAKNINIVANEESDDIHSAIDLALHKLQKQLLKYRDKTKEYKSLKMSQEQQNQQEEEVE